MITSINYASNIDDVVVIGHYILKLNSINGLVVFTHNTNVHVIYDTLLFYTL